MVAATTFKALNGTIMIFKETQIRISLVIVHALLRKGVFLSLNDLGYTVLSSYDNDKEMITNFPTDGLPEVILWTPTVKNQPL